MMRNRAKWYRREGSKEQGFRYSDVDGRRIRDRDTLARIASLVIPPAWTNVMISPSPASKIQVVGVDAAGRRQYLYHERVRERQQKKKFSKLLAFAQRLPFLRRRARRDLRSSELSKERVLALIVRVIDELNFRVGSERSVAQYKTFGITTLRKKHVQVRPKGEIIFRFVGKHSIRHERVIRDAKLAGVITTLLTLRGPRLFKYVHEDGRVRAITSTDVNNYIKHATNGSFTAKDFRTWGATVKAAVALARIGFSKGERTIKKNIVRAVRFVAEHLGNTLAVSRGSYVHPDVLKKYEKGVTIDQLQKEATTIKKEAGSEIKKDEAAVIAMLRS